MQKKSIWICEIIPSEFPFCSASIRGFYTTLIFSPFAPFSLWLASVRQTFSYHMAWVFVCTFAVCLRSRVAPWCFNLTCELCTIFIMLVLASLALNKSCVAPPPLVLSWRLTRSLFNEQECEYVSSQVLLHDKVNCIFLKVKLISTNLWGLKCGADKKQTHTMLGVNDKCYYTPDQID